MYMCTYTRSSKKVMACISLRVRNSLLELETSAQRVREEMNIASYQTA